MTPANMLPICPIAVKMAVRFAISRGLLLHFSCAVSHRFRPQCKGVTRREKSLKMNKGERIKTYYHEPRIYIVPLYKLDSKNPWKKRTTHSCEYVLHAADVMVRPDHTMRVNGSQNLGESFWMMRACGICPTHDPVVNMAMRMLYWFPTRFSDSFIPETCSFSFSFSLAEFECYKLRNLNEHFNVAHVRGRIT